MHKKIIKKRLRFPIIIFSVFLAVLTAGCAGTMQPLVPDGQVSYYDVPRPSSAAFFDEAEWNKGALPEFNSSSGMTADLQSIPEWEVLLYEGKPAYIPVRSHLNIVFDLPDGRFYGMRMGERGGNLVYYGIDPYIIADCSPVGIFSMNGKIYLIEGFLSITSGYSSLREIILQNGKWQTVTLDGFPGVPQAFTLDGNKVYIMTNTSLSMMEMVGGEFYISEIAGYSFVNELLPNSIIKHEGNFYIGMRGGIIVYNEVSKESVWYTKK